MSLFSDLIRQKTRNFISLSPDQVFILENHWLKLQLWNQRLNLTTIVDPEIAIQRHYVESLFLASRLSEFGTVDSIADVGSGGGFPGFPIGVTLPTTHVTLLESHKRKAVFLSESTRQLRNFTVHARRFEDLPGSWDVVVSRAVAWSQLAPSLASRTMHVALLTGPETLPEILSSSKISWSEPLACPGSPGSYVLLGSAVCST